MLDAEPARAQAAWQRLVSHGAALVPLLRRRARDLVAADPGRAMRCDRLRYRLLLGAEALRKQPGVDDRLAAGAPGARAEALDKLLKSDARGLEPLVREAACDPEPLFRETALRHATALLPDPAPLLTEALRDPEPNLRVAALAAMARAAGPELEKALHDYLANERDPDLIGHAVRALAGVKSAPSRKLLRQLLAHAHWQVRAAAAKALGEMNAKEALADLAKLLEDPDGFVAASAAEALGKVGDASVVGALGKAVERHPGLTAPVLKVLRKGDLRRAPETDKILRRFTKHDDPAVRAQALLTLASDSERPAFDEIVAGIRDPDDRVRAAAAEGLRQLISADALENFRKSNRQPDGYKEVREDLLGLLKSENAELRAQAVLTLCYFGDAAALAEGRDGARKPVLTELFACLEAPSYELREMAFQALPHLRPQQVLNAVRRRLAAEKLEPQDHEWGLLGYYALQAEKTRAAAWTAEQPVVEAYFALAPRLQPRDLGDWCERLLEAALGDEDDEGYALNAKAFARHLEARIPDFDAPPLDAVLRVLWFHAASPAREELDKWLADPRLEVRRAAAVRIVRDAGKGPPDLVERLLADPEPSFRLLGVVACIPGEWRDFVGDPTAYEILAGQRARIRYRYVSTPRGGGVVPVPVQLPPERLEKLLEDPDADIRAATAFLMAMEGGDQGLPILQRRFLAADRDRNEAAAALVRAVAMAWGDEHTAYLEKVYEHQARESADWRIRELAGEIERLQGRRIEKLKARIKKEFPNAVNW
ncbi:MAG: HEAT repeat domain-containing protein [Planctomycetota bacterium]|nr:HEAT repeat domain-containing protein [Planctomycetota bacterium]